MLESINKHLKSLQKRFTRRNNEHQTVAGEDAIRRGRQVRLIDVLNIALIGFIVAYVAYAKFYPFNVIDITNLNDHGKIPMVTTRVQAGTYAKYDIRTMRHTSNTITVVRNIVNGQTIPISASLSNRPAGPGSFVVEVLLPPNLNPGKFHFRICYQGDFALDRTVTECFDTEDFEVYLPEGVSPDSDGLTIPQDSMQPNTRGVPGQLNFDQSESSTSRTNLVENEGSHPTPPQNNSNNQNGNNENQPPIRDDESLLCRATGLELRNPLQLPISIC